MTEAPIPPACLADARRVLEEQDPATSMLEHRWPAKQWRAAIKEAMAELENEHAPHP
jgi:hypothetical protein